MDAQVLTVSTKGQISLPVSFRKALSIKTGDKLVAYAVEDTIMLKTIKLPSVEEFEAALNKATVWAEAAGYKESDINDIIKSVRKREQNEDCR